MSAIFAIDPYTWSVTNLNLFVYELRLLCYITILSLLALFCQSSHG